MRTFLVAIAFALAGSQFATAAPPLTDRTNMSFDPGHGTQVEYLQAGGATFLWYPGNSIVLPGHWKMDGGTQQHPAEICFRYGPNTYNPVTHVYGDKWECEGAALYAALVTEQAKGDVFGLAGRASVPFALPAGRTTIEQLAKRAGLQANLGSTVVSPKPSEPAIAAGMSTNAQCAAILAQAHASRAAMTDAGMLYYHGEFMGQHCVTVDYQQAFALLREAGDTADGATLLADLKLKAASGNPKAIAALQKMGLLK